MNRTKLDESRSSAGRESLQYWGFANFPNQVFRRAIKNGFDFTLMVVGRSGLGKSTFINTLFLAEINDLTEQDLPVPRGSTVRVEEKLVKLVENKVTLNLTLVDTPGFGDAVNNSKCWEPITNYIDGKFLEYFCEETKIERTEKTTSDRCVHLCLYFIEPSGHGLKAIDIEVMKHLHSRVNIVPLIAKADCLTKEELKKFKEQVTKDIESNDIKIYKFPEYDSDTETAAKEKDKLSRVPFAVIGSNTIKEHGGKKIRYREYPWGVVEVENLEHNDFIPLRDLIVRKNLIDLIDVTRNVHYENFRFRQMEKIPSQTGDRDPFTHMEEEKKRRDIELEEKKKSLDKVFEDKVREREDKIAKREKAIDARDKELRQEIEQRKAALEKLKSDVEDLRRGNVSGDSKSSLNIENIGKMSPEKTKKKTNTLSLWNRN